MGGGTNLPEGHRFIVVFKLGANRAIQFSFETFTYSTDKEIYYRRSDDNLSFANRTWSVISRDIPSFYKNYNTLGALADALCISLVKVGGSVSDLNVSISTGTPVTINYSNDLDNATNVPSGVSGFGILITYCWTNSRAMQVLFNVTGFYTRNYINGWNEWSKIQNE